MSNKPKSYNEEFDDLEICYKNYKNQDFYEPLLLRDEQEKVIKSFHQKRKKMLKKKIKKIQKERKDFPLEIRRLKFDEALKLIDEIM